MQKVHFNFEHFFEKYCDLFYVLGNTHMQKSNKKIMFLMVMDLWKNKTQKNRVKDRSRYL